MSTISREALITRLTTALEADTRCRAAWLGGSDANARADEWSDVDLLLIVETGAVEPVALLIEQTIRTLTPIRINLRLPMPTWHGFHQAFYQLENAPEHLMIDWVIMEAHQSHPWLEVERHGAPRILFDKDARIKPGHVDQAQIRSAVERKVQELRTRFSLFAHLPDKLVARGQPADAAYFYHALVLRPLVDLFRCLYCPDRYDFGFRYVRHDLPESRAEMIAQLCYPTDEHDLRRCVQIARAAFDGAINEWDARRGSGD